MYFQRFPKTFYSLDDLQSVQVITSIFLRLLLSDEIKNNFSAYDEYDVRDGETPEMLADVFYDNPELHWVILHTNDILDPRFDWPLSTVNLKSYVENKYANINGVHHYEDGSGNQVNANVYLMSSSEFTNFSNGSVIVNGTNTGNAVIVNKISSSNVLVTVSDGGFISGDNIKLASNLSINANITSTTTVYGTAVTNYNYEDDLNESKRRIKIIKPQFVDAIIKELNKKLENING